MADLVLLTGVSGYIARHVALELLCAGYAVRGTLRSLGRAAEVREALREAGADVSRLSFAEADLLDDRGWDAAARDCRYLVHTASPFPTRQPRDRRALVPAARGGTLRAIRAASRAGAEQAVVTSSVVSVYLGRNAPDDHVWSERDWTDVEGPGAHAYGVSKTEAERAAWDAAGESGLRLAAVNPAFVLGPLVGASPGSSVDVVRMMLRGMMPAVPRVAFGVVDVRDVARAHVRAMERREAAGRRFLLSGGTRWLSEIGRAVAEAAPARAWRAPRFVLPDALVRLAATAVPPARILLPELGRAKRFDVEPARSVLGLEFRAPEEAVTATVEALLRPKARKPRAMPGS